MTEFLQNLLQFLKKLLGIIPPLSKSKNLNKDDAFNAQKKMREEEMNRILEKINKKGMESLTKKEKEFLDSQADRY